MKSTRLSRKPTRGLSAKSVNNHLGVLGRMLRVAAKWKLIREVPEMEKLMVRKQAFDFLTFEEADLLMSTAKQHVPEWYPYIVVAIRTGLRVGEMLALR